MNCYRFGFLEEPVAYHFAGGQIGPLPQFADAMKWVDQYRHRDGFLYPPVGRQEDQQGRMVPNT